jgi:feruloyl esterase
MESHDRPSNSGLLRRRRTRGILTTSGAALVIAAVLGLMAACGGASAASSAAATNPVRSCATLTSVHLTDGTVTGATTVAKTSSTPSYCKVQVTVSNTPADDAVHVGVFLPSTTWNGSFIGTGGGGYVGGVPTTPCMFVPKVVGQPCAIGANYATADTDAGHANPQTEGDDTDGSWALNAHKTLSWQRIDDFGYLGVHEMTTTAKAVIAAYYGTGPRYSFFSGGSNGGRQALMEAQRYPTDYNGIAAASPAVNWTEFIAGWMWPELQMKWSHDFIPQVKFTAVNTDAIAACDRLDGVKDGIISDWQHCHYSASAAVGTKTSAGTITITDAAIINKIWQGPRGPEGQFLWYGYERGASFADFAGTTFTKGKTSPSAPPLSTQWYRYWLAQNPDFNWQTMTYAQFVQYFRQSVSEFGYPIATDNPNLTAFRNAGGKLVFWHGTYDPEIPTMGSVDYWNDLVRTMGGVQRTEEFARFFIAPGAAHVASGVGPAPKNAQGTAPETGTALGAVVNWVEHQKAPTQLLGVTSPAAGIFNTNGTTSMTRPICLYPLVARYTGHGSTNAARNFTCSTHF